MASFSRFPILDTDTVSLSPSPRRLLPQNYCIDLTLFCIELNVYKVSEYEMETIFISSVQHLYGLRTISGYDKQQEHFL